MYDQESINTARRSDIVVTAVAHKLQPFAIKVEIICKEF